MPFLSQSAIKSVVLSILLLLQRDNKIMDELIFIIEERRHLLNTLSIRDHQKTKAQLMQEQRKRNERQNWIIRILKTLKFLSTQQKKTVYDSIIKIMNYYHHTQSKVQNFEGLNYTETIINLFVNFYNLFDNMDLTHIKTIIRPNNNYIVVDLIKSIIEIGRKDFKTAILEHFKDYDNREKKYSITAGHKYQVNNKSLIQIGSKYSLNFSQKYEKSELGKGKFILQQRIDECLNEKYNRVIDGFNLEYAYEKANELYYDLLYLNQKNGVKIQKYVQSCFGPRKLLNYDVSGLYTQEQIKIMIKEQKEKSSNKIQFTLTSKCTSQQFKEYFKIKIEAHQNAYSMLPFQKKARINPWLPLMIVKNGSKLHPYNIMIQSKGNTYFVNQYQQKFNKKLKPLMREQLSLFQPIESYKNHVQNDVHFNKREYIDYNHCKVLQLLNKEPPVIKKQPFFPKINPNQIQHDDILLVKHKILSQTKVTQSQKLLPLGKQQTFQKQMQKKLTYNSFMQQMDSKHKSRLDSLIGNILKKRQIAF